jgi:hypothetical protein
VLAACVPACNFGPDSEMMKSRRRFGSIRRENQSHAGVSRFAEVRTAQGKLYLHVAIDRTSKFAFVELHEKVARRTAGDFLRRL